MIPEDNHKSSNSVSQYVRAAEELLTSGKYGMALEALSIAQEMDPQNSNLQAIVERALMLQAQAATNPSEQSELPAERTSSWILSPTVGKQFDHGVKSVSEVSPSPQEIHAKVKYLVDTATVFMDRGMNESAFESLILLPRK
jgi:thioredoxin-like negative regulator of GroEL